MKKLAKILCVSILVVVALCAMSCKGKKVSNQLVVGTNPEFPPFEFVSTNGVIDQYDGIDLNIIKQIGEDIGMNVKIESMEFDSLLMALSNGQIDATIAGMTVTEERKQAVDFSIPYFKATQVMIVKADSTVSCMEDLADKLTAVVQGYTGETIISKTGYKYESFKKGTECVMELVNGKCDAVIIDSATAQKYIADNPGLEIRGDEKNFENEEYAIAVKKGNKDLLDKINASIEKMLASGYVSELAAKYCEQ